MLATFTFRKSLSLFLALLRGFEWKRGEYVVLKFSLCFSDISLAYFSDFLALVFLFGIHYAGVYDILYLDTLSFRFLFLAVICKTVFDFDLAFLDLSFLSDFFLFLVSFSWSFSIAESLRFAL